MSNYGFEPNGKKTKVKRVIGVLHLTEEGKKITGANGALAVSSAVYLEKTNMWKVETTDDGLFLLSHEVVLGFVRNPKQLALINKEIERQYLEKQELEKQKLEELKANEYRFEVYVKKNDITDSYFVILVDKKNNNSEDVVAEYEFHIDAFIFARKVVETANKVLTSDKVKLNEEVQYYG